jgi:hypothetical protein
VPLFSPAFSGMPAASKLPLLPSNAALCFCVLQDFQLRAQTASRNLAEGGADVFLLHGPGRPCSGHHEPGEIASPSGRARACVLVWAPTYPPSVQTCSQHPGTGCQRLEAPSSSNVEQLRGRSCRSPPIPQTAAAAHLVQIMSRGLLKAGTVQTPPQLSKTVQAVQAAMQLQPSNSELDRE